MYVHAHSFQTHLTYCGFSAAFAQSLDSVRCESRLLNTEGPKLIWMMGYKTVNLKEPVSNLRFIFKNSI